MFSSYCLPRSDWIEDAARKFHAELVCARPPCYMTTLVALHGCVLVISHAPVTMIPKPGLVIRCKHGSISCRFHYIPCRKKPYKTTILANPRSLPETESVHAAIKPYTRPLCDFVVTRNCTDSPQGPRLCAQRVAYGSIGFIHVFIDLCVYL